MKGTLVFVALVLATSGFERAHGDTYTVNTSSDSLPDIAAPMSIRGPSGHAIQRGSAAATNFRIFNIAATGWGRRRLRHYSG